MTGQGGSIGLAQNLRDAFDRAFTETPVFAAQAVRDFVSISLATESYAVALDEVTGIVPARRIVSLPSRAEQLLGVTGLRGTVVPVYSAGRFLGHPAHKEVPRWLLVTGTDNPLAFGFERFDGFLRVSDAQMSIAGEGARKAHIQAVLTVQGQSRPVVSLRSMVVSIATGPQ